jgi:hypothetical protein
MLNLCGIVVAILKMATARNFWMSGIHSGHHNQCWESIRDIIIYPHMKCRWNRTMLNLCGIVVAILKMETGRNCLCRESISTHISNFDDIRQCWICAVLWWPFWKWRPVEIFQCQESIRDIIIYLHIQFWWYRTMLNFYHPIFYAVFWQPFWKWQTPWKFWKLRIAPLMVTYHYVKLYVSIIIHLEVININVQNFNFPIWFYSNPHPLWTPQNMTLTPFTTKLKTLGPTRNIYL